MQRQKTVSKELLVIHSSRPASPAAEFKRYTSSCCRVAGAALCPALRVVTIPDACICVSPSGRDVVVQDLTPKFLTPKFPDGRRRTTWGHWCFGGPGLLGATYMPCGRESELTCSCDSNRRRW